MNHEEEEDDYPIQENDRDSIEGEFQDLHPSEYKKNIPNNQGKLKNTRKIKAKDAFDADCEFAE